MYVIGLDIDNLLYFISATMCIIIPSCNKIFNYINSYYVLLNSNYLNMYNTLSLNIKLFVFAFMFGGLSGIVMSNNLVDICLHDTYYIVVHFHIILGFNNILVIISFLIFSVYELLNSGNKYLGISNITFVYNNVVMWYLLMIFVPMHLIGYNA